MAKVLPKKSSRISFVRALVWNLLGFAKPFISRASVATEREKVEDVKKSLRKQETGKRFRQNLRKYGELNEKGKVKHVEEIMEKNLRKLGKLL